MPTARIIPSQRVMARSCAFATEFKPKRQTNNTVTAVTPNKIGISRRLTLRFTAMGVKITEKPSTSKMLQTLEPNTLPIATLALPPLFKAATESETDTASSGKDVPIATIVSPMMSGETFNFFAITPAPSTNQSQNLTRQNTPKAKPTTNSAICTPTCRSFIQPLNRSTNIYAIPFSPKKTRLRPKQRKSCSSMSHPSNSPRCGYDNSFLSELLPCE